MQILLGKLVVPVASAVDSVVPRQIVQMISVSHESPRVVVDVRRIVISSWAESSIPTSVTETKAASVATADTDTQTATATYSVAAIAPSPAAAAVTLCAYVAGNKTYAHRDSRNQCR